MIVGSQITNDNEDHIQRVKVFGPRQQQRVGLHKCSSNVEQPAKEKWDAKCCASHLFHQNMEKLRLLPHPGVQSLLATSILKKA
jgi:hypothetical protein